MGTGRVKHGQVEMVFRAHGGKRRGAGRKPKGARPGASHAARPEHDPRHPVHVTMRVVGSASGLRRKDSYLAVREATIVTAKREDFRIVHMSIQRDHIHLIVEADNKRALSKGIQGFSISAARQIQLAGLVVDGPGTSDSRGWPAKRCDASGGAGARRPGDGGRGRRSHAAWAHVAANRSK